MAVGAGLSASFGIATETTVGTPVPVTRFFEFDSESIKVKKNTVQGMGIRQGGYVARVARRMSTTREAGGDVQFNPTTNGFGLVLTHMLGSTPGTPASVAGGMFRQVHTVGQLLGKSFTTQVVRPDTSGVLTQQAYTYPGCKVTDWELSAKVQEQLQLKLTVDALDEATPSNGFASTTLAAALASAGSTTISTTATIPAGAYVTIGSGNNGEVVQTSGVSGSGPYTSTLVAATKLPHAAGVYVGSATGVNYGAATALQTATYSATSTEFGFQSAQLVAGGTITNTAGVWSNTGGTSLGVVKSLTVAGKNALATSRYGMGSAIRSEQIDNGWREYTAECEIEFGSRALYDIYLADLPLVLQATFTTPSGASLQVIAPAAVQDDGGNPTVGGVDILTVQPKFQLLDDGVNGTLQIIYTSTDATV